MKQPLFEHWLVQTLFPHAPGHNERINDADQPNQAPKNGSGAVSFQGALSAAENSSTVPK